MKKNYTHKNTALFFLGLVLYLSSFLLIAKPIAFVSILPQKFLVESIAGNLLEVKVLVKPGQSPELFDPSPRQMAELSKAELFFTIGLNFEQLILQRIIANNMQLKIIQTEKGIADDNSYSHTHSHDHSHSESVNNASKYRDPHIWLDPVLVKQQVNIIYLALTKKFPEHKESLHQHYQLFLKNLEKLNKFILSTFSTDQIGNTKNNSFVIFHPALFRFAKRYKLNQIAIEQSGNKNSAKILADLMSNLKQRSVKYIIVEKQFSKKEAFSISKVLNAQLLEIDPLAESWFNNMYELVKQVHLALF